MELVSKALHDITCLKILAICYLKVTSKKRIQNVYFVLNQFKFATYWILRDGYIHITI